MTTSNHIFTGAIIALVVKQPQIALPLAFVSHFVLDALPHYGYDGHGYGAAFKQRLTFVVESINIVGVPLLIYTLRGQSVWVWLAAILAISPDFMWVYRYFWFERKGLNPPGGPLTRFHHWVQWCEVRWGWPIEFGVFGLLAWQLIRMTA